MSGVREVTINLRARRSQQDLIDRAARAAGKNRTDFMLEAACERAQHLLLDRTFFQLRGGDWQRFVRLLDAPPAPNAGLKRLLAAKPPWERLGGR